MTVGSQILIPISVLMPRRDLDKPISDTDYMKINWTFPPSFNRKGQPGLQMQAATYTITNPHAPRIHTNVLRVSLAKPLLQSPHIYKCRPCSQITMHLHTRIMPFTLKEKFHACMSQ